VNLPYKVHDVNIGFVTTTQTRRYHHGDLRRALVLAGVELAREGGPSAIVLREAARRVGVSPNAAYRHFDDLPALIEAVGEDARLTLARSMQAGLGRLVATGDARQDAVEALHVVGLAYVRFALAEPGLYAAAFQGDFPGAEPGAEPCDEEPSPAGILETVLDGLLAAGVMSAEDRPFAFAHAWSAVHGLSMLLLGPLATITGEQREAVIEATISLIGRGLLVRP
jgi:AcrR family transcriptional regulator